MLNNFKISFFLAYKSLRRGNIGTTILTVAIMSMIFVNLVFLPSIVSGIGEGMNVMLIDYTYSNIFIEPKKDNLYINNVDSIRKKVNSLPGVAGASAHYISGATFACEDKFVSGAIYSINPIDEVTVTKTHTGIIEGDYLSEADTDEILLGIDLAGKEGKEAEERDLGGVRVGDKITVTFRNGIIREYRVKGIFKTKSFVADGSAFITEKEMESVLGMENKASEILVKLNQRGTEEVFKKKFMELGISEDIKTWEDKAGGITGDIISSFSLITVISTVISLIMAVIVIFIIIYINTVNKRKQIGILKAVGIEKSIIIRSYVIQSLFYCFSGITIGSLLLYFLISYMIANPIDFPMGNVKPLVEQQLIIQSITGLIAVSLIAGFVPSWKTANENILKSIWG
ncbi:MAG: FtsX-like permease family protein [Methanosarcinales archaeon]|nr:MAG: FtsX-like permease family protein [Methanosarcinales archaeon]